MTRNRLATFKLVAACGSLVTLLSLTTASPVDAGEPAHTWKTPAHVGYGYDVGYGYGFGYGGGVGTAFSAQQNAEANTIRAAGEYNLSSSAAIGNLEEARSISIDNAQKWTQVSLERRRALQAQREEEKQARLAKKERGKQLLASQPPTTSDRLSGDQFDLTTGRVSWPKSLSTAAFESQRKSLDELFEMRAYSNTAPGLTEKIDNAVREMKTVLRTKVREMNSQDYIVARKFLDGLAFEVRMASN